MQALSKGRSVGWLIFTVLAFQAAGMAVVAAAFLSKQRGYFYSTSERVALFAKLPDAKAARMLSLIYADQPQLPEMALVRYALNPKQAEAGLQELRKDPRWAEDLGRVTILQFDPALAELASQWSQPTFEKLLANSDQGRALSATQHKQLDTCRENALKAMLREAPRDEQHTDQLCSQAEALLTRPWRLKRSWYAFINGASGQQQFHILQELEKATDPERQFALLRQVRLLAKIGNLESGNYHNVSRLVARAQENVRSGQQIDHNLKLLTHYQKLAHWVKESNLKLPITADQKKILDRDPWK